ncbi:hypothetical protein GCM10010472_18270 [Pseudonocardia halophobica]|uniref:Uncharacterized protein n=1 Tax=Pseudonocardia halophobica TaxID=29401 RepID=A0A9W6NUM3_9PSEU|nr:hypothetical protein GCM10017577_10990 [Pseudonocardia halophobica]
MIRQTLPGGARPLGVGPATAEWRGGVSVPGGNIEPPTSQGTPVTGTTEQQEAGDKTT